MNKLKTDKMCSFSTESFFIINLVSIEPNVVLLLSLHIDKKTDGK